MKGLLAVALGLVVTTLALPAVSRAADPCPAEVTEAKAALTSAQASLKSQEVQAPRGQQDIQAPRGQQEIQAPRVKKAGAPVREAEAACHKGHMTLAATKAKEALAHLKK